NFCLIMVGVWIWTGFCMVILSASYKGIPRELLEAARVDGATEFRIFWKIILPLMKPTLAVVATTMTINVLKVFDIVYVMTNGNFDTEVIANRMYKEMFIFRNYGRASSIAVLLLLIIIPMIIINIRRFREQEAIR
ncbi:MAG: sugar ABC transporter permease, partial [bacterium]